MDQQTKVAEKNGAPETESHGLAPDLGAFASDVMTLTELQAKLLLADVQECSHRALIPSLVLLAGLALGLACFPIALVAIALGLVQYLETSHYEAFLIVVGAGAISSALLCIVGWILIRKRAAVLRRSRDELVRNVRWIKKVVARNRIT